MTYSVSNTGWTTVLTLGVDAPGQLVDHLVSQ